MADSKSHSVFISISHRRKFENAYSISASNIQAPRPKISYHSYVPCGGSDRRSLYTPPLVFHFRAGTVAWMNKTVIEVQVRAVLPTSGGCVVFTANNEKVFIIYVDQTVGSAITMFMR